MEKYSDIIGDIKNLQPLKPPEGLVDEVMARLDSGNKISNVNIPFYSFGTQTIDPVTSNTFLGRITSHSQCAFLLFMVGFFYLVAGVATLWGFQNVIREENINTWLKIQPYITIANAVFLISAGFLILYRPQVTTFVQYALIVHATLILVNAYILQSIITFQFALVSVLIITILATSFAVLLIGAVKSVLRCDTT